MTARELIEELQSLDENDLDKEVVFAYGYGDHGRNTVVDKVKSIDVLLAVYSDYHNRFKLPKDDEDIEDSDKQQTFVVLDS